MVIGILRLLIADDEKVIRESLAECLNWEEIGIRVVGCCANGIEALDTIIDEFPDIVMTDIKMPGLNGLELIEKMQEIDKDIEFIILSGYREFDFAQKAIDLGVRRYLLKPLNEHQIMETVLDAMESFTKRHSEKMAIEEHKRLKQQMGQHYRQQTDKAFKFYKSELPSGAIRQLLEQLLSLAKEDKREETETQIRAYLIAIKELHTLRSACAHLISDILACQPFGEKGKDDFAGIFDDIYQETRRDPMIDKVVETALSLLWGDRGGNDLIKKVKRYVKQNLADSTLSLKQIATQYVYVNVDYLSRLFVQETGKKFSHYLNCKRVEKAKQLLHTDSYKVYQVAEQVGFGHNPCYFSQVFKKHTGMTPSVYAEKIVKSLMVTSD